MTTWFVSRHAGARDWAARKGHADVTMVAHFDPDLVQAGDFVLGTLPVHLGAEVCARRGRFFFLVLDIPPKWRGRDLSADEMDFCSARLEEYRIERL
jgi:CRISPR-associated protein Csx16